MIPADEQAVEALIAEMRDAKHITLMHPYGATVLRWADHLAALLVERRQPDSTTSPEGLCTACSTEPCAEHAGGERRTPAQAVEALIAETIEAFGCDCIHSVNVADPTFPRSLLSHSSSCRLHHPETRIVERLIQALGERRQPAQDVEPLGERSRTEAKLKVFLFRGLCRTCAPELHEQFEADREYCDQLFAAYKLETGREPLADWTAFEEWSALRRLRQR